MLESHAVFIAMIALSAGIVLGALLQAHNTRVTHRQVLNLPGVMSNWALLSLHIAHETYVQGRQREALSWLERVMVDPPWPCSPVAESSQLNTRVLLLISAGRYRDALALVQEKAPIVLAGSAQSFDESHR